MVECNYKYIGLEEYLVMGKTLVIDLEDIVLQGDILDVGEKNLGIIYNISKEAQDELSLDYVCNDTKVELKSREYDACTFFFDLNKIWTSLEKEKIIKEVSSYLKENGDRIIYHDQDALNAVLYEDWEQLEPKWNMQTSLIFERHPAPDAAYEKLYKAGNESPSIVHFTGHDKPWNTLKDHPYTNVYLKKLAHSVLKKVGEVNE